MTTCPECGLNLLSEKGLASHLEIRHKSIEQVKCSECYKVFNTAQGVMAHFRKSHKRVWDSFLSTGRRLEFETINHTKTKQEASDKIPYRVVEDCGSPQGEE